MAQVRKIRENLGLSQEAFAERAGLKYKHYQSVEAGRKGDLRLSTLEKLAAACGLELWELLHNEAASIAVGEDPPEESDGPRARRRKRVSSAKAHPETPK